MSTTAVPAKSTGLLAKDLVTRHPLIAFFTLAFVVTWAIDIFIPHSNGLSVMGSYGPFTAAVIMAAVLQPEKIRESSAKRWALFGLLFAIGLAAWWYSLQIFELEHTLLQGILPSAAIAFLYSGALSNRRSVRTMLAPAPLRTSWKWYLAALGLGAAIWLLPIALDLALGGNLGAWPYGKPTIPLLVASMGWVLFFDGASEEPGWRGFALPRMQKQYTPLVASIILGAFWSLWHLPLYFVGMYTASSGTGPAGIFGLLSRFGWVIPLAMIFTWLYNLSGKSGLMTVILLHLSFNVATTLVGLSERATFLFMGTTWAVAIVVVVLGRMWRHLPGEGVSAE